MLGGGANSFVFSHSYSTKKVDSFFDFFLVLSQLALLVYAYLAGFYRGSIDIMV
ncbi:hypothetical protein RsTz2092_05030 [Deferribacterales bacterium RsTz2092]